MEFLYRVSNVLLHRDWIFCIDLGFELALQESAKEWSLGCVKCALTARGGQEAGITQPRDHSLADSCEVNNYN